MYCFGPGPQNGGPGSRRSRRMGGGGLQASKGVARRHFGEGGSRRLGKGGRGLGSAGERDCLAPWGQHFLVPKNHRGIPTPRGLYLGVPVGFGKGGGAGIDFREGGVPPSPARLKKARGT